MCKKTKKRKSQRKNFKVKSIYSIPKLIVDIERCISLEGEVRQIFVEEMNVHFRAWQLEQISKGLMNLRAEEIAGIIDLWQNKAKELKEESKKPMASKRFQETCLSEAGELMAKCRYCLDMTTHHKGTTSKDYLDHGNWEKR